MSQIARGLNENAARIESECGRSTDFTASLKIAADWIIAAEEREGKLVRELAALRGR